MKLITLNKADGGARSVIIPPPSNKPWDVIECDGTYYVRAYGIFFDRYREATFFEIASRPLEQRTRVILMGLNITPREFNAPAPLVDILSREARLYVRTFARGKVEEYHVATVCQVDTSPAGQRRTRPLIDAN